MTSKQAGPEAGVTGEFRAPSAPDGADAGGGSASGHEGLILRDPGVLDGKPFLAGTRMGVHAVIGYSLTYNGDAERILREFPHLSRTQIDAARAFYEATREQRAEIDGILRRNRDAYQEGLARQQAARRRPVG